jgi:hypothetical protein
MVWPPGGPPGRSESDVSDSATAITNLIYHYAELIDGGDLDGVARLFERGRICGVENGPPETVFAGTARVREMYEMATRIYARSTSYYCVTQATPDLPLQVIITGHYQDTFQRLDGAWWFDSRTMFVDQVGDVSHHLKF